jgi:hypothetical protein
MKMLAHVFILEVDELNIYNSLLLQHYKMGSL